jgi:hypothetical protein
MSAHTPLRQWEPRTVDQYVEGGFEDDGDDEGD